MSVAAPEDASQPPARGSCSPGRGKKHTITWSGIVNADGVGGAVRKELDAQLRALNITPSKEDEDVTWAERWTYMVEKFMSYSDGALFYLLFVILMFLVLVLGSIWYWKQGIHDPFSSQNGRRIRASGADDADGTDDAESQDYEFTFVQSLFIAFQVILSAGYDETIEGVVSMLIYSTMILVGLIVLGLLIGMITESFETLVEKIRSGELKAVEKNHTLVLGWNEGTVRLVCQLAFLRRQWLQMNESWERTIFPWRRVPPSTIVARGTIVVMCNTKSKAEMEQAISHAFAERGISKRRTRLGCDVVCRSGNPSDVQDLQRVGAQHAVAFVLHSQDGVDPRVAQGTTLRSLMALRFVLYTAHVPPPWEHLRIVVEMSQPSRVVGTAAFGCPHTDRSVVHMQDMSIFLNGLLFACLGQPGLAQVQLDLMCFETAAIKFRKAREFYHKFSSLKGATVADAMLLWEDAVLVGVRKHAAESGTEPDGVGGKLSRSGLLPDPSDLIEPEDTVLFLCRSSMPQPSKAQHEEDDSDDASLALSMVHRRTPNESGELAVLICGWRSEWDSQPGAFLNTLREIATARHFNTRMSLHFLCRKSRDDFREFMAGVVKKGEDIVDSKDMGGSQRSQQTASKSKLKKNSRESEEKPEWLFDDTIGITHTFGDPETLDDLEGVIKAHMKAKIQFNEAIVLPPRCRDEGEGEAFDKLSQDTWVMSVMLMLRHFQQELNITPMHVITENALDATSKLAMAPSSEGMPIYPDFVNSHAIRARALCQVLAYPEMGPVLKELYSKDSGCPNLLLIKAGYFGLTGQKLTFRQVTRRMKAKLLVRRGKPASDVCLGWQIASGKLEMPPMQSDECQFCHGDKLIIITDRATSAEQYESDLIESLT